MGARNAAHEACWDRLYTSVTKTFTGALLAIAVREGEVQLDGPAAPYLPKAMCLPAARGKEITFRHLITHSSGLPRVPDDFYGHGDPDNLYATYRASDVIEFLGRWQPESAPGEKYSYSNLGVGLAGMALAHVKHLSYEEAIRSRICAPLGMSDTVVGLSRDQRSRLAPGYNLVRDGTRWTALLAKEMQFTECFAGCGALRSTADDMLKFLVANLDEKSTPLGPVLARSHEPLFKVDESLSVAMGWQILRIQGPPGPLVFHPGGIAGYSTYIGFCKETDSGVVVLANGTNRVDDIAAGILCDISRMRTVE